MCDTLTCVFCGATATDELAPEEGWAPSFWHENKEYCGIGDGICPICIEINLTFNKECGDWELKTGKSIPIGCRPFAAPRQPTTERRLSARRPISELIARLQTMPAGTTYEEDDSQMSDGEASFTLRIKIIEGITTPLPIEAEPDCTVVEVLT